MKTQEKGLLLLYLRKLTPSYELKSLDVIMSFRHDMTPLYLSCNFLELMEIPIYENDSTCELNLDLYAENEELKFTEKLKFEDLKLKTDTIQTYSLQLTSKKNPKHKFFLIFDAYFKSSLSGNKNPDNNVMKIKIEQFENLTTFLSKRAMVNRDKHLLKKHISNYQYFLQMTFFEQKFALEISREEENNLNLREFFFIYDKTELEHPLTIELLECEYEKLTPEDDLTFMGSLVLESQSKPLKDILNSDFQLEDNVHHLKISFNCVRETSNYLLKMPTYTSLKLLSSTFFDPSIKDSYLMVRCLNASFSWSLSPLQTEISNQKAQFVWNHQHSVINSKALQDLKPDEEINDEELKEQAEKEKLTILSKASPLSKFEALLLKYKNIHRYDKILGGDDLPFQNKENEILFVNELPYDYVTFELFDSASREKKGVCQVCVMDLEEDSLNLEFLLDPKLNTVVGNMSFLVEFQGNKLPQGGLYKVIDTSLMLDYDDFNKFNYTRILQNNYEYYVEMEKNIKKLRGNYFTRTTKMVKLHLEIEEIWNSFELMDIPDANYLEGNFSLIYKIGNFTCAIPVSFLNMPLNNIKSENPNVYKALVYEKQMQVVVRKSVKNAETTIVNIYFMAKKQNEVVCLSFEKGRNFWAIVESPFMNFSIQLMQKSKILMFHKGFVKDVLIFKERGTVLFGMEVRNLKKIKNTAGFHSSCVFLKFNYEIKENLDYAKENFNEGFYQVLLVKDERNIKKSILTDLKQFNYEIVIKDEANVVILKQSLKFQENLGGNILLPLYELKKVGGLSFILEIHRLFSEDDEEYQLNVILNGLNTKSKLLHSSKILLNFMDIDLPDKSIKQTLNPNSYSVLEFSIHDNKYSLKSKEVKSEFDFPVTLLILYKCNKFIEKMEGSLLIEIPETTLQYYLSNGYSTSENSLKFSTMSAGGKQNKLFSFKGKVSSNTEEKNQSQIVFNLKKYTQIIIVQMLNSDNSILDSDSIRISDFLYHFDENYSFKHNLLFNNKPFTIWIKLRPEGGFDDQNIKNEPPKSQASLKLEEKKSQKEKSQNVTQDNKPGRRNNLSDLDQLKMKITTLKKENATLATQLTREQKIIVVKNKTIEELEDIINRSEASLTNYKKASKPIDQAKVNKARELFYSICVCGAPNPIFKGYCKECLEKMKTEYEKALADYLPLNEKLENLSMKNQNHNLKMGQIKRKIENLKIRIKNCDLENQESNEDKFLQDDLNYYKEKQILLEAEIELIHKKYQKTIMTKQIQQKETEQKLVQKSEKLSKVADDTEMYIKKIKEIQQELQLMSKEFMMETNDNEEVEEEKVEEKKEMEEKKEDKVISEEKKTPTDRKSFKNKKVTIDIGNDKQKSEK